MNISVELATHAVAPGEAVTGRATLNLPGPTAIENAEVMLYWRTEGRGTEDTGVGASETFIKAEQTLNGQVIHEFTIRAPLLPWTYYGQLLKIHWWVGVFVKPARGREMSEEVPLLVHPDKDYASRTAK